MSKKKKYTAHVWRTVRETAHIEIQAVSQEAAAKIAEDAWKEVDEWDFDHTVDSGVISIRREA